MSQEMQNGQEQPQIAAVIIELVTLNEWQRYFAERILNPATTITQHQQMFARACASRETLNGELTKLKKAQLERLCGMTGRDEKKPELVKRSLRSVLEAFALGADLRGSESYGFVISSADWRAIEEKRDRERFERLQQTVAALTGEDLNRYRERVAAERAEDAEASAKYQQALDNPQTEADFKTFIQHHGMLALRALAKEKKLPRKEAEQHTILYREGIKAMDDDQLARYDELQAAKGQERRAAQLIERSTIKRIEIGEGNYMEVVKHWHGRREVWQWIVVLAEREDRTTFDELCIAAGKLRGYYQRAYTPANSPGGFAFDTEEQAERFVQTQSKDVFVMERLERLIARRERVRSNAIAHFGNLSESMAERAQDELTRPRKENTERRINQAENARDAAHDQLAMAGTLRSYALALQQRITKHTDRIRWRTHAEAFERLLDRAGRRMSQVEYPWPVVAKHTLLEVAKQIGDRDGSILITNRVKKLCSAAAGERVAFVGGYADTLRDFYRRARLHRVKGWALDSIREALADYKRCRLNNLDTLPELRAALREHSGIRVERTAMTKADKVMQDLYPGKFPPDYFPTPPDVAKIMLDYAGLEPGMTWLEPECGAAHLANAIHEQHPDTDGRLIELSGFLVAACKAQDWMPLHTDFLSFDDWHGAFDRIIANPPFGADGTGTDIEHVRHMYPFLKPGGRITTLMSDGVFYRGDARAQEFRSWLEEEIEQDVPRGMDFELPEGAFLNSDRPTSWAARVVVVEKGGLA